MNNFQKKHLKENILEKALEFIKYKNQLKNRKQAVKNFIFSNEFNLFSAYKCDSQLTKKEISELFKISNAEVYRLTNAVITEFKNFIDISHDYKEAA